MRWSRSPVALTLQGNTFAIPALNLKLSVVEPEQKADIPLAGSYLSRSEFFGTLIPPEFRIITRRGIVWANNAQGEKMAKPPPTVDRFKLSCDCEVSDLGAIIAQLTKMGLTNLHFELVTDVANYRQKTAHDIKAAEFLRPWLADHPTFKAREAIKHFRDDGRTDGAGYSALRELTDEGVLKKLGEGNYARADVKAISAPKKKAKPDKPAAPDRTRYAVPNPALIMRIAKRHKGTFTSKQMKKAFEKDGRPTGSVAPALTDLLGKKAIKRVGEGEYQIIEAPAPKTNGNGAPQAVDGVANG